MNGLLLQAEDFRGDGSEVRLEVEEHFLHTAQQRVALDDLREKNIKCYISELNFSKSSPKF